MTRTSDTNLNDHVFSSLRSLFFASDAKASKSDSGLNFVFEKFFDRVGRYGVKFIADGHANALLALTKAERTCDLYLVLKAVVLDDIAELLHNLTGALQMAGTTDTNSNSQ